MSTNETGIEPVVFNAVVEMKAEDAFRLFTDGIASWWPLETHSVGGANAKSCVFEAKEDGAIYEIDANGERHVWGRVVICEPGEHLVFTWHPGRAEESAQEVEMYFDEDGSVTHIELIHSEWEKLGESAQELRDSYETGWAKVVGECFAGVAGSK